MFEYIWKFGVVAAVYWFGFAWLVEQSNWHNHNAAWYVTHTLPALPHVVAIIICGLIAAWWAKLGVDCLGFLLARNCGVDLGSS